VTRCGGQRILTRHDNPQAKAELRPEARFCVIPEAKST
jgi:hypothetical protein